jgi:allantoinase
MSAAKREKYNNYKAVIELLKSNRVLTPEGLRPACIAFESGRIVSVLDYATSNADGDRIHDVGNHCVLPGLVDSHVHVNEPGRTEWEGFESATKAAAAGGCTCIIDMPLNSIPATTNVGALREKQNAAKTKSFVDYAFWGGVVPGNAGDLLSLAESGVRGFKCFLSDSGVPEFHSVTESDLHQAMPIIASTGFPLLVHAESASCLRRAQSKLGSEHVDWGDYSSYLRSHPPEAEVEAVEMMIRLSRQYGCRVHIVHVSAGEVLPVLRRAKSEGVRITAETCPHYLHFAAEQIPPRATTFKCAPPIRDSANRELLWDALVDGTLDLIATDHSPCTRELKQGDFATAWGGISSLSIALSAVWSGAQRRGIPLECLSRWMSANTATLAGFSERKGELAAGRDADFVVFDPERSLEVRPEQLFFRHACSPYVGQQLLGEIKGVFVRGKRVFRNGKFPVHPFGERLQ